MNLYIRFFNDETIVTNVDDAMAFLNQVTNGQVESTIYDQLNEYINSPMPYPRRFKVKTRTYFICIKTQETSMEQFKARGQQMQASQPQAEGDKTGAQADDTLQPEVHPMSMHESTEDRSRQSYDAYQPGWYEAEILFKRVMLNEAKGKNEYVDTSFTARVKAHSVKECYELVCRYLLNRDDVDNRSQMPSIKGRNFNCRFLGMKI